MIITAFRYMDSCLIFISSHIVFHCMFHLYPLLSFFLYVAIIILQLTIFTQAPLCTYMSLSVKYIVIRFEKEDHHGLSTVCMRRHGRGPCLCPAPSGPAVVGITSLTSH